MSDNSERESQQYPLNLTEEEALWLWDVMKREMANDQETDERDVIMSLHSKVHDVVRSRHD